MGLAAFVRVFSLGHEGADGGQRRQPAICSCAATLGVLYCMRLGM
jgi:hypothetical protein